MTGIKIQTLTETHVRPTQTMQVWDESNFQFLRRDPHPELPFGDDESQEFLGDLFVTAADFVLKAILAAVIGGSTVAATWLLWWTYHV